VVIAFVGRSLAVSGGKDNMGGVFAAASTRRPGTPGTATATNGGIISCCVAVGEVSHPAAMNCKQILKFVCRLYVVVVSALHAPMRQ
jgi:hypothetical protein